MASAPITNSVPELAPTAVLLTKVINMRQVRDYLSPDAKGQVHVFEMGEGGPAPELHVAVQPSLPVARQGAGAVRHVAFRVPDRVALTEWHAGERVSRAEFRRGRAVLLPEPLFPRAGRQSLRAGADGPGFNADEPFETMGEALSLPPFLEPRRAAIEARAKPLR